LDWSAVGTTAMTEAARRRRGHDLAQLRHLVGDHAGERGAHHRVGLIGLGLRHQGAVHVQRGAGGVVERFLGRQRVVADGARLAQFLVAFVHGLGVGQRRLGEFFLRHAGG